MSGLLSYKELLTYPFPVKLLYEKYLNKPTAWIRRCVESPDCPGNEWLHCYQFISKSGRVCKMCRVFSQFVCSISGCVNVCSPILYGFLHYKTWCSFITQVCRNEMTDIFPLCMFYTVQEICTLVFPDLKDSLFFAFTHHVFYLHLSRTGFG